MTPAERDVELMTVDYELRRAALVHRAYDAVEVLRRRAHNQGFYEGLAYERARVEALGPRA